MSSELAKAYEPASVEQQAYEQWLKERAFHAEPSDPGAPYSIVIPPPNVTAALHLGHALNNTLQDILIRQHRMMQNNTCWLPGTDHAGIATQTVVEKRVLAEEGKKRTDFQRDEFVKKIQAWKDEYEARITEQLKRMGCSCDWDRQAFTMDEPRAKAVREAFFRLFKDGLIYRGKRLVNWDPATQTALADDEVEMEEIDGFFYYLRYPLADGSGHVTVATTRPETMLGDTAVAINPKDPRAAGLRGKSVRLPIVNRVIPVVEDEYVVLPNPESDDAKAKFATGFLKVTPAHDPNDYAIGERHKLETINVLSPTASISREHGWPAEDFERGEAFLKETLLGKSREEARKLVVAWFKEHGLLEEVKPYRHSVGHSYRSHVAIEPWLSDQWYCRVTDPKLAGAALRTMASDQRENGGTGFQPVSNAQRSNPPAEEHGLETHATSQEAWEGQLRFYPARYAKTFQTWHENIRDWCISRQLWWGHRIPVWSRRGTANREFVSAMYRTQNIGFGALFARDVQLSLKMSAQLAGVIATFGCANRIEIVNPDSDPVELVEYVCPPVLGSDEERELVSVLETHGFTQDPDVLDTWFSSALWPLSTLNWPEETAELEKWNPTSVLCTAREIITLWVSRMVMFNLYFLDRLPFRDVFIHAMIQDGHGQKMSKSLGNGVDPVDIIHSHGADAMRFTLASMATNTQDVRMPVDLVDPHSGEMFTPKYVTDSAGYSVAAPIQESPRNPKKKMVSSYGLSSGKAQPTNEMPLARNTSSKFDLGRNFCNKLWNAARFALMNLSQGSGDLRSAPEVRGSGEQAELSLADRWVVSRFGRTVKECEEALGNYRFDQYAKACYDFVWRDFCDWYLEAIKPAMRDPQRSGQTARVLASVLDGALRLLHPAIPFITEIIWWKLNETYPQRGLAGQLECPASERLVKASWPNAGAFSDGEEAVFGRMQEIVAAIRNVRSEYKADPKKAVTVAIKAPQELIEQIEAGQEIIETLGLCKLREVQATLEAPVNAARAMAGGCEVYVENLIDPEAEKQRLGKRREELAKQVNALRGRLSNHSYVAKAPPALVQQTREQLAKVEAELEKLGD